ncbi:hypothetical protein MferCBS31731_005013 [Microsporum ferrugineum]
MKAIDLTEQGKTILHRIAEISANNGHYDGATVLAGRLIKPGSNTEARAVVPDDTYRHMLKGYYLRLALQEEHPPAHRQIPLHYAPSNGLIVVVKTLLISLATIQLWEIVHACTVYTSS